MTENSVNLGSQTDGAALEIKNIDEILVLTCDETRSIWVGTEKRSSIH